MAAVMVIVKIKTLWKTAEQTEHKCARAWLACTCACVLTFDRCCNLQQFLCAVTLELLPGEDEPCKQPRDDRSTRRPETRAEWNSVLAKVREFWHWNVGCLERHLDTHDHKVAVVHGQHVGALCGRE
jgi:hypothetical protein